MAVCELFIVYCTLHGHVRTLAEAQKRGASAVPGVHVSLYRVPNDGRPACSSSRSSAQQPGNIPEIEPHQLAEADGFLFGFPLYFGNVPASFQALWDHTTALWTKGALTGKLAGTFFSASGFNSGQETAVLSFMTTLANHGIIYMPLGSASHLLLGSEEPHGCSAFGAGTLAGHTNERTPSQLELLVAEFQGHLFAQTLLDLTMARRQSSGMLSAVELTKMYASCKLPGVAIATTNTAAVAATSAAVMAMERDQALVCGGGGARVPFVPAC
ncbi:flavo protein-like protein [Syncephalis pseudoplumigaleata]|uniref:Flavo protein-like protein n=1 Tax=Syncephalis pseudoplumigaleata TaxID=1712513 RepID=A0A4P9Z2L3_9FUNG|nr:flavo protein-like protein [Syncephalis pseudoplumigaleata]|eukprot:RKP26734.1 flavo protein-like protein [Syncephalis pseudoplumigaleata]